MRILTAHAIAETQKKGRKKMQSFYLPTKIIFGEQALQEVIRDKKRAFIVTDRFMHDTGKVDYVTTALNGSGAVYEIFSDVKPDPDITIISKGVEKLLTFCPDIVIAFGGGSPIDAAKSVLYFAKKQTDLGDLPLVAIPTTSGTGSEVSRFAVVTDAEKAVKYLLVDDALIADYAVLDPTLLTSLPAKVTADTGIDVFTHAIEAFVSKGHSDFSDALAEKSVRLVYRYLLKAYKEPENLFYRTRMHNASCLAGAAFSNAGLGINHSMAHALGARFHISHGRANGILLPYVMSYNAGYTTQLTKTAERYAKISRLLELESTSILQSVLNVIRTTLRFLKELEMPTSIKELGISEEEFERVLPELAETAIADHCTATNPEPVTVENIMTIYRQAWLGKWW